MQPTMQAPIIYNAISGQPNARLDTKYVQFPRKTIQPTMQAPIIYNAISGQQNARLDGKYVQFPRMRKRDINDNLLTIANKETDYTNEGKRIRDPSEKLNYIKRIWMVAKDVTHKLNFDDVIAKYQKILKLNPKKLSKEDLKLLIVPKERARTWKNYLTPKFLRGNKYSGQYVTPNLTRKNKQRIIEDLSEEAIRNYQLNAYNELIGIMIILMEKARDKYAAMSISKTLGSRRFGHRETVFKKFDSEWIHGDKGGVVHIDNLSEDYVQSIFGYNLDKRLNTIYGTLKDTSNTDITFNLIMILSKIIGFVGLIVYIVALTHGLGGVSEIVCPPNTTFDSYQITPRGKKDLNTGFCINNDTGAIIKVMSTTTVSIAPLIDLGTLTATEILSLSLGHGIPTAIMLSYKTYKMYRGYKRKTLLKDIFINIHEAIFNKDNTFQFEDVKDELFIYKDVLSQAEQDILSEDGPNIDSKVLDKEMYEYTGAFLNARKEHLDNLAKEAYIRFYQEHAQLQENIPQ
jgi:hypothetical protein